MSGWLSRWRIKPKEKGGASVSAAEAGVAVGGDNVNSPITIGMDEERYRQILREELPILAIAKGVPEAPLRKFLAKLGEKAVPEDEITARLDAAADELIRLRADLAHFRNDRPEFAAIRARVSAFIDEGEFDAARTELRNGREAARTLREEASRLREKLRRSEEEFSRSEAEFLANEARIDKLQLNHHAAREKFVEATHLDPDVCWIWFELGDLWMLLGSLNEAEKVFRVALKTATRSGNARDLSVSHNKIGDVQVQQGNLIAALASYEASDEVSYLARD
jgi:tetratricopeptide (TPR) repeat protein